MDNLFIIIIVIYFIHLHVVYAKNLADACKGVRGEAYFHIIISDCITLFKHFDNMLVDLVCRSLPIN